LRDKMIDEKLILAVQKIASARKRREFPLLEQDYPAGDVRFICEAFVDLARLMIKEKK